MLLLPAAVQAQGGGIPERVAALERELGVALAAIAQLRVALATDRAARRAADRALREMDATLQQMIEAGPGVPESLMALAPLVRVDPSAINGLAGPHIIFEGVNVHIRSGSGKSHDGAFEYERFITTGQAPLGLGNLVVGYNEEYPYDLRPRTGSHNVVVGPWHGYTGAAGLITGLGNTASSVFNAVAGGPTNTASEAFAVVSGGAFNTASGWQSAISGGLSNTASAWLGVVSGGERNTAEMTTPSAYRGAVVSGSQQNTAQDGAVVSGGSGITASGVGTHLP